MRADVQEVLQGENARIAELEKALLWDPFGNGGMRYMESADVTGGATDMVDNAPACVGADRARTETKPMRVRRS